MIVTIKAIRETVKGLHHWLHVKALAYATAVNTTPYNTI
jgi:hypothetical protein